MLLVLGPLESMPSPLAANERLGHVGMVFQFPERHFLGHNIRSELTFGWSPLQALNQDMLLRLKWALSVTGLNNFSLEAPTTELSDGFKRRLALAVQLVRNYGIKWLDMVGTIPLVWNYNHFRLFSYL